MLISFTTSLLFNIKALLLSLKVSPESVISSPPIIFLALDTRFNLGVEFEE